MVLARSSVIKHPHGFNIKTPLLIPSFSSKGFKLYKQKKKRDAKNFFQTQMELSEKKNPTHGQISEVAEILKATSETLTEAILASAYDIFHQHIPLPYLNVLPEIIFLDSGGYEAGDIYDDSEVISATGVANEWGTKQYVEVLNAWPKHVPAVFVSNDYMCRGMPVADQIKSAKKLFSHYRENQICAILIKPVSTEFTFKNTLQQIVENIKKFKQFDIFAVAESDLGNSVLSRMENIATIRLSLDKAKVHVPIHIFGSLDPLSSCLYFLAGAEIFDGLTWLRYGYFEGMAIYYRNHGIITLGVHEKNDLVRARNINDNIYYLRNLQEQMKEYLLDRDFKKFKYNVEILEEAFGKLRARFEGRNI